MFRVLFLFLISTSAIADTSLVVGGFSYHIGEREYEDYEEKKPYNEVNPTLGVCVDDWCLVRSKLSYHNWGTAVYNERMYSKGKIAWGIRLGLVHGYEDTPVDMKIVPMFQPIINFSTQVGTTQTGVMFTGSLVLTVNYKYKF